ncbi:MAG: UDP-N-acetylmuramoyl-tripeptide--D-alanyl-D-alanine ligase [Clostridium sp.]|nr:UDP-N-acetylmuramoyl-tripeptide--D-alanyl-D-alanine ligase [Clostridium sp.]
MNIERLYSIYKEHPQVTTDSRSCPENALFFALRGESFDGNRFAAKALEAGCAYAVVDDPTVAPEGDPRYIVVDNALVTLQQLAAHHRRALGIPIVQVTGTNGKTTTKELMAAVLKRKYRVWYTQGNLNNHIGVPLTLLQLTPEHEIAVVETGANHPGEIKALSEIADANYGIITNVGICHIEGFGSFEGVVRTKSELYDYLRHKGGTVLIHKDNTHLMPLTEGLKTIRYGAPGETGTTVEGEATGCTPCLRFRWRAEGGTWHEVQSQLIGDYNLSNLLAAATAGYTLGVSEKDICHALADYTPGNNRSQWKETEHNRLIIDTYNANLTSMTAALTNFSRLDCGKKMVILGDMKELGCVSTEAHRSIVEQLKTSDVEQAWLVGSCFKATATEFRTFDNVEQVKDAILQEQPTGFTILIKGSHSTKLYQLPELL